MTAAKSPSLGLPADFLWGASTSAYQIEGAAAMDGRGPSIWDTYSRMPGRVSDNTTGEVAADHYHRWPEDIALMREMGLKAYRFSVSWPRVLPRGRGVVNEKGLEFYDRLIDGLLEAGIQPWLCLYHWDLPQALDDLGGWTNRDVAGWFADYTTLLARRFGDRVKHWCTVNEPNVSILFGYAFSWNAPGVKDRAAYFRAAHHLNLAHGAGVDVVRDLVPGASIGVVHNRQVVYPEKQDSEADAHAAQLLDAHWNRIFPDPQILGFYPPEVAADVEPYLKAGDMARICRPLDWFGLNHYGPIWARAEKESELGFVWGGIEAPPHPEIGWPVYPDAFREELLLLTRRYKLPIYVTENGCGGEDKDKVDENGQVTDPHRIAFLRDYTRSMAQAHAEGADVRGYFVWCFLDNFEWASGLRQRFGIVYVDYENDCRRIPKASAKWYAHLVKTGAHP